jgi:small subunit ribosomal protein S5
LTQQYNNSRRDDEGSDLVEHVVQIRRVAKVVKGGRNLTFNAMVVVGDGKGRVGAGLGKGKAVPDAVRTGTTIAKANMVDIPLAGATVPHAVTANFGASKVVIKPGAPGTGVKAGGAVRAVMEAAGVRDIVTKSLGSRNPINVVKAAIAGLEMMQRTAVDGEQPLVRSAVLPPISPDRRGPLRREGGGGFRGRDRDRDRDRRGPSGPPRAPSFSPPRADGPPSDSVVAAPAEANVETIPLGLPTDVVTTPLVEASAAVVVETPTPSQDETIGTTNDG